MADPIETLKELTRQAEEHSLGEKNISLEVESLGIRVRLSTVSKRRNKILQLVRIIPWNELSYDIVAYKIMDDAIEEFTYAMLKEEKG